MLFYVEIYVEKYLNEFSLKKGSELYMFGFLY